MTESASPASATRIGSFASGYCRKPMPKCDDRDTLPGIRRRLRAALETDDLYTIAELGVLLKGMLAPPEPVN